MLLVLDTWGTKPGGSIVGNRYDFGHFDQCIDITVQDTYHPQYCHLGIENGVQSFTMGVCVPKSCSEASLLTIFSEFIKKADLALTEQQNLQCITRDKPDFDTLQWVTVSLLIVLAVFVLSSTLYDIVKAYQSRKASQILSAFSIFRNIENLFETRHEAAPLECLNGLRVLSMLWIILYYSFTEFRRIVAVYNPNYYNEVLSFFTFDKIV